MSGIFQLFFYLLLILGLSSCGKLKSAHLAVETINERISPTYDGPPELPYCSGSFVFGGDHIVIAGNAGYEYREIEYTSTFRGLGKIVSDDDDNPIPKPVRRAEVVILDSQNNVVQCGETDNEGDFSLTLPRDGALYRVRVHSRGLNDLHVRASVLRSPESNHIYYVEKVITADTNKTLKLIAKGTGTLEGGAFHIFDQILTYNEKLRDLVGNCNTASYTGCTPFTTAPKVNIYWEKGFNPGSYLPGSPISSYFYQGTNRIFLLGGIDGDVDYSDTDHFDKSIIAHEYFHFLESTLGKSSSPGGNHNGNQIIDPRLAWSEGAAQYFQGVMLTEGDKVWDRVLDSRGNISGASALVVDISIEHVTSDDPEQFGEGEFREFSVARVLWDSHDDTPHETPVESYNISCSSANIDNVWDKCAHGGFPLFWSVLTGPNGFRHNKHAFVSASLAFDLQRKIYEQAPDPSINWVPLQKNERQPQSRYPDVGSDQETIPFGTRLIGCTGSPHWYTMKGPFLAGINPSWQNSHLVNNNNFLYFYHAGGSLDSDVIFQFSNGITAEINYILYIDNFYLYHPDDIIGHDTIPSGSPPTYSINIGDLPAGNYMMNINVVSTNGVNGQIDYNIRNNGAYLCPEQ